MKMLLVNILPLNTQISVFFFSDSSLSLSIQPHSSLYLLTYLDKYYFLHSTYSILKSFFK